MIPKPGSKWDIEDYASPLGAVEMVFLTYAPLRSIDDTSAESVEAVRECNVTRMRGGAMTVHRREDHFPRVHWNEYAP